MNTAMKDALERAMGKEQVQVHVPCTPKTRTKKRALTTEDHLSKRLRSNEVETMRTVIDKAPQGLHAWHRFMSTSFPNPEVGEVVKVRDKRYQFKRAHANVNRGVWSSIDTAHKSNTYYKDLNEV